MLGVIISAVAIIMLGYLCVGLAGYLAFPTTVAGNVLLSFPEDDWLMQARSLHRSLSAPHMPPVRAEQDLQRASGKWLWRSWPLEQCHACPRMGLSRICACRGFASLACATPRSSSQ